MTLKTCSICGKPAAYRHPEDPEQRICRACKNRLERRARGLQKPGRKPEPEKLRSRYNPDNPRRLKSSLEDRRRPRVQDNGERIEYDLCPNDHELTPNNTFEFPDKRYAGGIRRGCKICRRNSQWKSLGKEVADPNAPVNIWNRDKTHCPANHEYTEDNIYWLKGKYRRCRKCLRYRHAQFKYGISPEDFERLLEQQGNKCGNPGCSVVFDVEETIHVDHDHETQEVRGLLCSHCNHGLGNFLDDRERLFGAVDYLENPPAARLRQVH
jgi:hypothetical protein